MEEENISFNKKCEHLDKLHMKSNKILYTVTHGDEEVTKKISVL